jgi:hypothetical protein
MLAFGKSYPQDFHKDVSEFKRKNREEIWEGNFNSDVIQAVRLAPSACNTQPWRIFSDSNWIKVKRQKRTNKLSSFFSIPQKHFLQILCNYFPS